MHNDFIDQMLKAAPGTVSAMSAPEARVNNFRFRTLNTLPHDRHAATEVNIFIHGYSAGHDEEDRKNLLNIIPQSTSHRVNVFAFWNSSHFSRFNKDSRRSLGTAARVSPLSSIVVAVGDRASHFLKIRQRAEDMGRSLFTQLESYLRRDYPNVKTINLVGHSLGGRLIVSSLKSLVGTSPTLTIKDVLLMAAAVEVQPSEAEAMRGLVRGRMMNAYSKDDWALLLPMDESCLGRREVEHFENIRIDGFGHGDYWKKLQEVLVRAAFGEPSAFTPKPMAAVPCTGIENLSIKSPIGATAMTLELETPSEIYQCINAELAVIVEALNKPTNDATLDKAQADALEQLAQRQAALHARMAELEKNAEWNTFTIAFYGETGAGKSTLIETLRILLQEPEKLASQQAFRDLRNSYRLNEEKIRQLQQAIEEADSHLDELAQRLNATLQLHEPSCLVAKQALDQADGQHVEQIQRLEETLRQREHQCADAQAAATGLETLIAERKKTLSLWERLLCLFRKTPEEVEMALAQRKLLSATAARDGASAAVRAGQDQASQYRQALEKKLSETVRIRDEATAQLRGQQTESEQNKLILSRQHDDIGRQIAELVAGLEKHADGDIIGDGRADFTRQTQRYNLQWEGQPFSLLDVPGIEGKEGLVLGQIEQAVQKAHAVFYVTNRAAPPQTGEGEEQRQGTLEKIKQHLGAQTEVWTIFNKKITNAKLALTGRALTSSDEDTSLAGLDEKMREHLGEHYREAIPVTALAAFLASTDHLVPESQHVRRRDKMLADFSAEELLQKSRLPDFMRLLGNNLLKDADTKITHANFNKARQALDQATATVDGVHQSLAELSGKLDQDGGSAKTQLDSSFQALRQRLDARGETLIDKFSSTVRNGTYALIDRNISDSDFKDALRDRIESEAKKLDEHFPEALRKEVDIFQKDAEEIIQRFEDHAKELTGIYSQLGNTLLDGNFEFKIEIDNGINVMGLVGGLIGLALAPFTGGASLWMTGMSAISMVVSIGKALYKIGSKNYKKSQQRKATEDNLRNASERLYESLRAGLNAALPKMENIIGQIEEGLEAPAKQAAAQAQTLGQSARKMNALSLKIAKAGNH